MNRHTTNINSLLVVFLLAPSPIWGQDHAPTHSEQRTAMGKLNHLVGEWKGSGWIQMGARRFEFESSERFASKAGGLAMFVEGLHHVAAPDGTKQVVHDAAAMIVFDPQARHYRFISSWQTDAAVNLSVRSQRKVIFVGRFPILPKEKWFIRFQWRAIAVERLANWSMPMVTGHSSSRCD